MTAKEPDLYERELARYRRIIARDPHEALQRYGMTLMNSLNPAERAQILKELGDEITDAMDFYNLGVQFAQEENWSEAILYFKRSVEQDPDLLEAIYNLALCYEKTGHTPQAKSTWQVYADSCRNPDEAKRIAAHIGELE